mmetsp:Transcript_7495/g.29538  ORF Transcript_7495/g.29538 Transcript_7495/m.29538 type:complete len:257 (-) Transcript_7495:1522-2292(-)
MVPLLPLLRLRLVHAPERERGGVPLALRGARAVGQREEVDALAVRFPSRELAAVASTVGEGEPTPAVLVPVGVHLPAEDALAILVELLDQAGKFAVVPEARAPGAVARDVLGVSLDGVVDEGPHHAIPSRGESLERGLGHRPVFTIAILILILILPILPILLPILPVAHRLGRGLGRLSLLSSDPRRLLLQELGARDSILRLEVSERGDRLFQIGAFSAILLLEHARREFPEEPDERPRRGGHGLVPGSLILRQIL